MENFLQKLIKFPILTLLVIALLSAVFFVVMRINSRMETDLDQYMPQEHPAFVYSNQAEGWFNIGMALSLPSNILRASIIREPCRK